MHYFKSEFDKYLSENGLDSDKVPKQLKALIKHAWMSGAACVVKNYVETYNKNPKAATPLMQAYGNDAKSFDSYAHELKDQWQQGEEPHAEPHDSEYGQKWWGGRGWGGWGGWGRGWGGSWGWPSYGGWGGGWPYSTGWYWKDIAGHGTPPYHDASMYQYPPTHEQVHHMARPYGSGYSEGHMAHPYSYHPSGGTYTKDHPYARAMREGYPDLEAQRDYERHMYDQRYGKKEEDMDYDMRAPKPEDERHPGRGGRGEK
jgi:hypothetical protein